MKYLFVFILLVLTVTIYIDIGQSRIDKNKRLRLKKPDIVDLKFIATNNWRYVMRNNGSYMYDSPDADGDGNNAGGVFPRSDGTSIVFAGGFYIGTIKDSIPVVSEVEFATEYRPGRIINNNLPFDSLRAEDFESSILKVYVIDQNSDATAEAEWPGERDRFAEPALIADAQTWAVFNDLDTTGSQEQPFISPNPGLGLEITLQSYAFSHSLLSDAVILRMTVRNKTLTNYPQSYIGLWSDPDVNSENAVNDIVGVDTARGLGFCYNATNEDRPLAVGFDFIQGPIANYAELPSKEITKFQNNVKVYGDGGAIGNVARVMEPAQRSRQTRGLGHLHCRDRGAGNRAAVGQVLQ